jgi:hypothetical protein
LVIVREYAACFGTIPAQLFDDAPPIRLPLLPPTLQPRPLTNIEPPLLALVADHSSVLAIDERLRFAVIGGGLADRGRLVLPRPLAVRARPIVACSRKFAVAAFPWSSSFSVFIPRSAHAQPIAIGALHTRPITALAICQRAIVSASQDCTVRLWRIGEELTLMRMLAKHSQPITFVRTNERLRQAVSVSRDGFVMAIGLRDGRYLRGFKLALPDPSDVVFSESGFVAICFNDPDSHIVVVLDQNLKFVCKKGFDGCVQCWAAGEYGGIDHLIVGMRHGGIRLVRLPLLDEGRKAQGVSAAFIAYARGECFVASAEGAVSAFTLRHMRDAKA